MANIYLSFNQHQQNQLLRQGSDLGWLHMPVNVLLPQQKAAQTLTQSIAELRGPNAAEMPAAELQRIESLAQDTLSHPPKGNQYIRQDAQGHPLDHPLLYCNGHVYLVLDKKEEELPSGAFKKCLPLVRLDGNHEVFVILLSKEPKHVAKGPQDEARMLRIFQNSAQIIHLEDSGVIDGREFIILPFCNQKDLLEFKPYLESHWEELSSNRMEMAVQFAIAMEEMHHKKIVHLDLKRDNLLVQFKDGKINVFICDLGTARKMEVRSKGTYSALTGSVSYSPPECFKRGLDYANNTTDKADIWAAGLILCYLLSKDKTLPFKELRFPSQMTTEYEKVIYQDNWLPREYFDDDRTWRLVSRMLSIDPNQRPSAKDVACEMIKIQEKIE